MSKKMWLADTAENLQAKERALAFLEKQVEDPDTRKKLTPTTNFGCKRLLVLDDWYPIFNLPNVHLITDKPIRITEDGIISKPPTQLPISELKDQPTGAYSTNNVTEDAKELDTKIDVLIWGTGFDMAGQGSHFQVYGLNGILLEKQFGDRPQAFYSVAVANFPNFLMMLGPNSANFWSTLPVVIQIQAKYNAKVIKRIKQKSQKKAYAMSVTMEAQNEFNKWINENMDGIALASPGCSNYYTNSKGEVTYHSPMHSWTYAWRLKWPNMNNYTIISPHSTPSGVNGAS
jgi:cation diffusion facilitator CzcD-associated flavoprotein CzcO